jgi:hypothetical protein
MKTRRGYLSVFLITVSLILANCNMEGGGSPSEEIPDSVKTPFQIYSSIGDVLKIYRPISQRYASGDQVTIKGKVYTFEASLIEYSILRYELLYYFDFLDNIDEATMYQTYEDLVYIFPIINTLKQPYIVIMIPIDMT